MGLKNKLMYMINATRVPTDVLSSITPLAPYHTINPIDMAEITSTIGKKTL
jgi:hypothetical protein